LATSPDKWKLNAAQGLIIATLILAVIGGTLGALSLGISKGAIDLTSLGPYAPLIVNVLNGAPLIVIFIWIYNIFMYFRQNRLAALKGVTEKYDITKLLLTLTWFIGILGPVAAALPQYKEIINVIVLVGTGFVSELKNVWSGKAPTPLEPAVPPAVPPLPLKLAVPTTVQDGPVGTYKGWIIEIQSGRLHLITPPAMQQMFGVWMDLGSITDYPANTNFMTFAVPWIDEKVKQYDYIQAHGYTNQPPPPT
jgi:hypothetical protein